MLAERFHIGRGLSRFAQSPNVDLLASRRADQDRSTTAQKDHRHGHLASSPTRAASRSAAMTPTARLWWPLPGHHRLHQHAVAVRRGSTSSASPPNPWLHPTNPKINFKQGRQRPDPRGRPPPARTAPSGTMWIALSKPTYGIHGTPGSRRRSARPKAMAASA